MTGPLHRRGSGPRLLLLHCLGVDHRMWDIAAAGLQDAFTLLTCDFPGHGTAEPAVAPYDIAALSHQVANLLHGEGRVHVAGISLGGLVAQHLAATRPDLVDRLVLIDTTPRYTDAMRAGWAVRAATARHDGVAALIAGLLPVWFTGPAISAAGPAVRYVRDCFMRCDGEAYALACEALAAADLEGLSADIVARTMVICGQDDVQSFQDAARWLTAHIDGARLDLIGPARHASVLEQPEAFTRLMRSFLA